MKRRKEQFRVEESTDSKFEVDSRRKTILVENSEITENDSVFRNVIVAIESGWEDLSDEAKNTVLDAFEDLLKNIKRYHDSYANLKGITTFKPSPNLEAVKRYQGEVSNADRLERALHNSFLDSVNILARSMKKEGLDISWYTDQEIYDPDYETMRTKVKHWMFRVFAEKTE